MCIIYFVKKKSYGYEIMKELEVHNLKLKRVGSIYPILTKLKIQEWVNTYQEVTDSGKVKFIMKLMKTVKYVLRRKLMSG